MVIYRVASGASRPLDRDPAVGVVALQAGHSRFLRHRHQCRLNGWYTFRLALRGEATCTIDAERLILRPGSVVYFPDRATITLDSVGDDAFESLWFTCCGDLVPGLAACAGFARGRRLVDAADDVRIADSFRRLLDLLQSRPSGYPEDAAQTVMALCLDLRRLRRIGGEDCLLRALDRHAQGIAACAAACGLSPSQYRRRFRAVHGVSPWRMVLRRRIERAQDLLDGDRTLAEVASAVGMHDATHLCRVFRRITGVTPGAWRDCRNQG